MTDFWLPEEVDPETGDGFPLRPDLPWFRNLRWVKIHAMQIGFAIGIIVYWGQSLGLDGTAYGIAVLAMKIIMGEFQEHTEITSCQHDIGVHDLIEKPWYGIYAAAFTYVAMSALWGAP